MPTRRLLVAGRVQGVGYRFAMHREARRMKITGWVRNRRDGTVEALVQGAADDIEQITAWARHGPPAAAVTEVAIFAADGDAVYIEFEQLPTV